MYYLVLFFDVELRVHIIRSRSTADTVACATGKGMYLLVISLMSPLQSCAVIKSHSVRTSCDVCILY